MKVIVNYDLINSIRNVNEQLTPMKVIRNKKWRWVKTWYPLYLGVDFMINDPKQIPIIFLTQAATLTVLESITAHALDDPFQRVSERDLKILASLLCKLNIDTSYDLLKDSRPNGKKYQIRLSENKVPQILESKYILVPTYTAMGDIKDTSLLQEHIVGSNRYVLSLGSKQKKLVPAYSQT